MHVYLITNACIFKLYKKIFFISQILKKVLSAKYKNGKPTIKFIIKWVKINSRA